jgi:hypothetical protein
MRKPSRDKDFDYSKLEPEVAERMRKTAAFVRKTVVPSTAEMIDVGRRLREAKDVLRGEKRGSFGAWLRKECADLSTRTVERYMAMATLADKNDTVSLLPPRALQRLAARGTPEQAREEVITKLEARTDLSSGEVTNIIQRWKKQLKSENLSDGLQDPPDLDATTTAVTAAARDFEITDSDEQRAAALQLVTWIRAQGDGREEALRCLTKLSTFGLKIISEEVGRQEEVDELAGDESFDADPGRDTGNALAMCDAEPPAPPDAKVPPTPMLQLDDVASPLAALGAAPPELADTGAGDAANRREAGNALLVKREAEPPASFDVNGRPDQMLELDDVAAPLAGRGVASPIAPAIA